MKKYIYTLLAALAMLTSCTNDDIDIKYEKDEHFYQTFTYDISTRDAYDTFDVTSELRSKFLSGAKGNYCLGIFTYIYDASGTLVAKDFSTSEDFNMVSQNFTLENGDYTFVTVEMIIDQDANNQSDFFEIVGWDKLTSIEIAYRKNSEGKSYTYSTYDNSIGVSTEKLTVNQNTSSVKVTPKAIGAVIDCKYYNLDKSDYNLFILSTHNCPLGRYLDPSRKGGDRFHNGKPNEDGIGEARWWVHSGDKKLPSLYGEKVYLIEEGTDLDCRIGAGYYTKPDPEHYNLEWWGPIRNDINDGKIYYAGLYYVGKKVNSTGLNGGIFETTSEFNNWYNQAKNMYVPDTPTSTFSLMTPNTNWKSSVSSVQSSMSGYTMFMGSAGKAEDLGDGAYVVGYVGKGTEDMIVYNFKTMTNGLFEADVFYDKSTIKKSDIKSALDNKYTYVTESNGMYMYANSNVTTVIILMETDNSYVVGYVDYAEVMSSPSYISYAQNKAKKIKSSPVKPMMKSQCSSKIKIPFEPTKAMNRLNIMK